MIWGDLATVNNFSQGGKAGIETPLLGAFNRPSELAVGIPPVWVALGRAQNDCEIDPASRQLLQVKHFGGVLNEEKETVSIAKAFGKLANSDSFATDPRKLSRASREQLVVQTLQQNLAVDSVRNEHTLHYAIHALICSTVREASKSEAARSGARLVSASYKADVLDQVIYANLLRTPLSDPWMGLVDPSVYPALSRGGRTEPK